MIDFIYNNVELANSLNATGVETIIINGLFKKYDIEIDLKKCQYNDWGEWTW